MLNMERGLSPTLYLLACHSQLFASLSLTQVRCLSVSMPRSHSFSLHITICAARTHIPMCVRFMVQNMLRHARVLRTMLCYSAAS